MTVLSWDKPARVMPREEREAISADGAPPGVYTPNMSRDDQLRWKAKLTGTRSGDPRAEIRKTVTGPEGSGLGPWSQVLVVVRDGTVVMSMNSRAVFSRAEWAELHQAVDEARDALARTTGRDALRETR